MAAFLLEAYIAATVCTGVEALAARAREAAAGLSAAGRPVRCLGSVLVAEDETCFFLFEAGAAEDVREAAERAELPFCRVSDAFTDQTDDAAGSAWCETTKRKHAARGRRDWRKKW